MKPAEVVQIMIVDDHPMTVDGYVSLLSSIGHNDQQFHLAYSCKDAFQMISNLQSIGVIPHIAFLDLNLPSYEEEQLFSGTDIALLLRNNFPNCKLVVISMHKEPVWVDQIFKNINPEGFISKNDINYESFPIVYETILNGESYISPSILEARQLFLRTNIQWDALDSKILQLLSEGVKTINLPNYIALSLSTIEKRKANIKRQIIFGDGSDKDLIDAARNFGLI